MLDRAYIEITNVCNLSCSFCPKTGRSPYMMSKEEFEKYARKLRTVTDCFYLHVMGEPLCHPRLDEILSVCDDLDARVVITTNGTLLREKGSTLLTHACVYKIQISLQSFEANKERNEDYLDSCIDFACVSSGKGIITVLRLWNRDGRNAGENSLNGEIEQRIRERASGFWSENKRGYSIRPKLYLEYDERFVWPSKDGEILSEYGYCHAIKRQIAVLCDGTVVPCCMDREGELPLGNLKECEIGDALGSKTAREMTAAFEKRRYNADLCRTCGYADRFHKKSL